jgi:membrane protein DedA with SNARE-associated domain
VESWLTAAMPSLAGAAGLRYGQFAPRVLAMRVPWLGATLTTGTLAAQPVARLGHVIGLAGILLTGAVLALLLVLRWKAATRRRA